MNTPINVRLLGADKELLHCYHLYGFAYVTDMDSAIGEFVVPKDADTFTHRDFVTVKLCVIKEFAILSGGQCRKITVDRGLQLRYPGKEELFLNFDPDGPDPVFIPCK